MEFSKIYSKRVLFLLIIFCIGLVVQAGVILWTGSEVGFEKLHNTLVAMVILIPLMLVAIIITLAVDRYTKRGSTKVG